MLDKTRWYLRRAVFRTYRYLKHPRRLKTNPMMRWFARHFLDKRVWRPCQQSFASGVAIGVFVSAQLIPGQMLIGILLAAIFRANIPTVVTLSWLSNPVTFAPIGLVEKQFGDWLLGVLGDPMSVMIERIKSPEVAKGVRFAQSMYLGGLASGLLGMPIGYLLGWVSWTAVARLLRLPSRLHLPKALLHWKGHEEASTEVKSGRTRDESGDEIKPRNGNGKG
jgi:uncharacterized protein (DUF2062 family)